MFFFQNRSRWKGGYHIPRSLLHKPKMRSGQILVSYTAVLRVVTQRSGEALCDDPTVGNTINQTLESWFINLEQTSLNRCQQLPAPCIRLTDDISKTNNRQSISEEIGTCSCHIESEQIRFLSQDPKFM